MPKFELKPEQHQISKLFDYSQIEQFIIPIFQRPYSWKLQHCEQLWDDIELAYKQLHQLQQNDVMQSQSKNEEIAYFLGSIIVYPENNNKKTLNIIDGQQRITTLMLLLRAIYTTIEGKIENSLFFNDDVIRQCKSILSIIALMLWKPRNLLSLESEIDKQAPRLRRDNCNDDDDADTKDAVFNSIMKYGKFEDYDNVINSCKALIEEYRRYSRNGRRGQLSARWKNIIESNECLNYSFFMLKCDDIDLAELTELFTFLYKYCYVLLINTDSPESALDTFEILNNRGIQLSDADIFKNRISRTYADNQLGSFKSDWNMLTNTLRCINDSNQTLTLDGMFRHYMYAVRMCNNANKLMLSKSKEPKLRDFYTQNELGKSLLEDSGFLKSLSQMTKFLVLTLDLDLSEDDHYVINNLDIDDLVDSQVRCDISILNKYQKYGKWQYLISTFWYCYKSLVENEKDRFREKFKQFMRYSASVLFLKVILTGASSDADIPQLCEIIALQAAKENRIAPFEPSFTITPQLDARIVENRQILSGELERQNDNGSVVSRLDEARAILSGDTSKLNFLVLLYTYSFDENAACINGQQTLPFSEPEKQAILLNSTIEHILPQKWQTHYGVRWRSDCNNDESQINEYVEHLGNKIILPRDRNIRASDRAFVDKLVSYGDSKKSASSPTFELKQFIAEHQTKPEWTRECVDKRTNKMIDVIIDYIRSGIEGGIA